jgi:hypothetical protein
MVLFYNMLEAGIVKNAVVFLSFRLGITKEIPDVTSPDGVVTDNEDGEDRVTS